VAILNGTHDPLKTTEYENSKYPFRNYFGNDPNAYNSDPVDASVWSDISKAIADTQTVMSSSGLRSGGSCMVNSFRGLGFTGEWKKISAGYKISSVTNITDTALATVVIDHGKDECVDFDNMLVWVETNVPFTNTGTTTSLIAYNENATIVPRFIGFTWNDFTSTGVIIGIRAMLHQNVGVCGIGTALLSGTYKVTVLANINPGRSY